MLFSAAFLAGAGAAVLALLVKISIFATYYMLYKSRIRQIQQQIRWDDNVDIEIIYVAVDGITMKDSVEDSTSH